jgi:hypothetical protein
MYSAKNTVAAVLFVALGALGLSGCLVDSGDGIDESADTPTAELHSNANKAPVNDFDACALNCMNYRDQCLATGGTSTEYCEGKLDKCLCSVCGLSKLDPRACDGVGRWTGGPVAPVPPLKQK